MLRKLNNYPGQKDDLSMEMLHAHIQAGNPVTCGTTSHEYNLYDVKLEAGKWYACVFEPNNIEDYKKGKNSVLMPTSSSQSFAKGKFKLDEHEFRKAFATHTEKGAARISLGYFNTYIPHYAPTNKGIQEDFGQYTSKIYCLQVDKACPDGIVWGGFPPSQRSKPDKGKETLLYPLRYSFHAPDEKYKPYSCDKSLFPQSLQFYGSHNATISRSKESSVQTRMDMHPGKKYFVCPASTIKGKVSTIFYTRKDSEVKLTITEWTPRVWKKSSPPRIKVNSSTTTLTCAMRTPIASKNSGTDKYAPKYNPVKKYAPLYYELSPDRSFESGGDKKEQLWCCVNLTTNGTGVYLPKPIKMLDQALTNFNSVIGWRIYAEHPDGIEVY